jgi:hypothetical protein
MLRSNSIGRRFEKVAHTTFGPSDVQAILLATLRAEVALQHPATGHYTF